MLGIPLRYLLKHPVAAFADLAADPIEIWTGMIDAYADEGGRYKPQCQYEINDNWERHLHEAIGVALPDGEALEFHKVWSDVIGELEAKNIQPGPESFQWWNDGDAGLARAIWCLTR